MRLPYMFQQQRLSYSCRTGTHVKRLPHRISRTMETLAVVLLMTTPPCGEASTSAQCKAQCYAAYHDCAQARHPLQPHHCGEQLRACRTQCSAATENIPSRHGAPDTPLAATLIPADDPQPSPLVSQPHPAPLPVDPPPTRLPSTQVTLLGYTLYKGDLHAHPRGHCPDSCPGEPAPRRPMDEVFQMAKMTGADFFAVTDHDVSEISASNQGGEAPSKTFTEYEAWGIFAKDSPRWLDAIDYNAAFVAAGNATDSTFVGFVGYERTQGTEHLNIFNMQPWVYNGSWLFDWDGGPLSVTLDSIVSRIHQGHDPIIQFNHPEPQLFYNFALKPVMADKTHLLEVQHDSQHAMHVASFRRALTNGWKVSPVATSDRHTEYGTEAFPGDFRQFAQRTGVAVPQWQPLTQANLFDALRQRRTFSSSNPHLAAMYTANSAPMGSALQGGSPAPVAFDFVATETFPDRTSPEAQNICAIELWTSEHPTALHTWVNSAANATYSSNYTMARPYFKNYYYIVRAAHVCDPAYPTYAESTLITAPIWTAAQYPKPVVTSPPSPNIQVVSGDSFTVQWSAPSVSKVKLQVSTSSGVPWEGPNEEINHGQYTWSTAGWPLGSYTVTIADAEEFPNYVWGSRGIVVTAPPSCGSRQKCCEPALGGGCYLCVPRTAQCP